MDSTRMSLLSSGALAPWVWSDVDENNSSSRGLDPDAQRTTNTLNRTPGLPIGGSLDLEGSKITAKPRFRRGWMRNPIHVVERRSRSELSTVVTTLTLAPSPEPSESQTLTQRLKLNLGTRDTTNPSPTNYQAQHGNSSAIATNDQSKPHRQKPEVQPFLGPELKKALAKQGMAMQRLSLEPDEWDTNEVQSMLGAGYASKQDERACKHIDWCLRNMGPKFVERLGIAAGDKSQSLMHAEDNHHDSNIPKYAASRRPADFRGLLRGNLTKIAIINTSQVLNLDHLATSVDAYEAVLPGLFKATTSWADSHSKDLTVGELVRARLPSRQQTRSPETKAPKDQSLNSKTETKSGIKPLLVPQPKQRLNKKSRYLERGTGTLRLGCAGLHPRTSLEPASSNNTRDRTTQDQLLPPKPRTGGGGAVAGGVGATTATTSLFKGFAGPAASSPVYARGQTHPGGVIDTSGDPGRGGFMAQERHALLSLSADMNKEDSDWSISAGLAKGSTSWDVRDRAAACSF